MTIERRIRIGDWLVPYDDATKEVVVERKLIDIFKGTPGNHLLCMNSICIRAQRNRHVFPHDVFIVSTIQSRVYIVDVLDAAGLPAHAVRYELTPRDSALVKAHDHHGIAQPGQLRLRLPRDPKGSPKRAASGHNRFAAITKGRYSGSGKYSGKQSRPVASYSKGSKARFVAAVGALSSKPHK
jgi:hypothetical protein